MKSDKVTDAVKELKRIIEIEGVSRKDGLSARKQALNEWVDNNILEVVVDNDVIKKNLTSEEEDFLKYYLAYQIADKLLEECATVVSEGNKIRVKILALAKKYPKNKD